MDLTGAALIRRLEALRGRHRLNPVADDDEETPLVAEVVRTVCSDGLSGAG